MQFGLEGYINMISDLKQQVNDETELEALCAEISSQHHSGESPDSPSRPCCTFTYVTMTGEEVELCQGGRSLTVRLGKILHISILKYLL